MKHLAALLLLGGSVVLTATVPITTGVVSKPSERDTKGSVVEEQFEIGIAISKKLKPWRAADGKKDLVKTDRLANQTYEELAAECGSLGVLEVPEGEDPTFYRKCRDHPDGHNAALLGPQARETEDEKRRRFEARYLPDNVSPANPLDAKLIKRACWFGKYWGCTDDGWCWSRCSHCGSCDNYGAGYWCWIARNGGSGAWLTCFRDSDCVATNNVGCRGGCSC